MNPTGAIPRSAKFIFVAFLAVSNGFAILPSNKPGASPVRFSLLHSSKNKENNIGTIPISDSQEDLLPHNTEQIIDHQHESLLNHIQEEGAMTNNNSNEDDSKFLNIVSSEPKLKEWLKKEHLVNDDSPNNLHLPLDVVVDRTWDTIEDVMVHLRRKDLEHGKEKPLPSRKTVVVLGSGWGAHAFLKLADCKYLRVIVISPTNHFVFTPMLPSSAVGTVEYRSMTEPVRSANPCIEDYYEGKAIGVDVEKKVVTVKLNSLLEDVRQGDPPTIDVPYDHLVCSVGCRVNDRGVPGANKALRIKTLDDARILRRDVAECFEYASRPDVAGPEHTEERTRRSTFLIVGGGPTGVELAGELLDLAKDITRINGPYPRLKDNIQVIVAHGGPELVPPFESSLRKQALKSLEKKGAKIYLNTFVNEVGDGFAKLSTKILDEQTGEVIGREETTLSIGLTVWCAGVAPVSFTETLLQQLPESARNRDGRIVVDKWLRPPMPREDLAGSVLVIGDAAACLSSDDEHMLPQTAQVAGQQGAFAARMLGRGYDLKMTPPTLMKDDTAASKSSSSVNNTTTTALGPMKIDPMMRSWLQLRGLDQAPQFIFLNLGILAYLGGGEALSQVQLGDFPLFSYFGSAAFVLWRSVYLVKQVATRNRVLVSFDWIKSFLFGRDMTRF